MNDKAIELHQLFKKWYRSPKYCSHVNCINGLSKIFIIKKGFTEENINELIENNIIENDSSNGYRMTKDGIENFMNYTW